MSFLDRFHNYIFQALILNPNKVNDELPGFENTERQSDDDEEFEKKSKKTGSKKGGGFQAMGLSYPVLKGIIKRGYKIPTPIQRKVILFLHKIIVFSLMVMFHCFEVKCLPLIDQFLLNLCSILLFIDNSISTRKPRHCCYG